MKTSVFALVIAAGSIAPLAVSAQSVDQLLADHALLRTELDRCKQMGMASNDDARCRTARSAEQQRFFGGGVGYTQRPVDVFPGHEQFDPQPNSQKPQQPPGSRPQNGQ